MTTNKELSELVLLEDQGIGIQRRYLKDGGKGIWYYKKEGYWNINQYEYRRKPEPMEAWINEYPSKKQGWAYSTPEKARAVVDSDAVRIAVHMREVVENE